MVGDSGQVSDTWLATDLSWQYEPSDSLREAIGSRSDSLAAAGGHGCRPYPVSFHLPHGPNDPFDGRYAKLAAGDVFRDTLRVMTRGSEFVRFPGTLAAQVSVLSGHRGAPWSEAKSLGSASFRISVPK